MFETPNVELVPPLLPVKFMVMSGKGKKKKIVEAYLANCVEVPTIGSVILKGDSLYLVEPSNTVKSRLGIEYPPSYETISHESGLVVIPVVQLSIIFTKK